MKIEYVPEINNFWGIDFWDIQYYGLLHTFQWPDKSASHQPGFPQKQWLTIPLHRNICQIEQPFKQEVLYVILASLQTMMISKLNSDNYN